jgi:hypothetical protein
MSTSPARQKPPIQAAISSPRWIAKELLRDVLACTSTIETW